MNGTPFRPRKIAGLTFTVNGYGGLSQPAQGLCQDDFWWANDSGGKPASIVTSTYSFPILTGPLPIASLSGSLLLSSEFSLGAGDGLKVKASALMNHFPTYTSFEFGLLLKNSQLFAVLFNLRPDGITSLEDMDPISELIQPSSAVTSSKNTWHLSNLIYIGGVPYGPTGLAYETNTTTTVTASVTPGPGSYQLLFGALGKEHWRPTAVVVHSVEIIHQAHP